MKSLPGLVGAQKEKQKNVGYDFKHRTGRNLGSGHLKGRFGWQGYWA